MILKSTLLLRYAGATALGVLVRAYARFWLDNKNRKLFESFREDFAKAALVTLNVSLTQPRSQGLSSSKREKRDPGNEVVTCSQCVASYGGRASHRERGGHGFKSRWSRVVFSLLCYCFNCKQLTNNWLYPQSIPCTSVLTIPRNPYTSGVGGWGLGVCRGILRFKNDFNLIRKGVCVWLKRRFR